MRNKIDSRIPRYNKLIMPAFAALKKLGGSGANDEILDQVIKDLNVPDEVADIPHTGRGTQSELSYQLAWAKTYLSKYGAIQNSARSVWSIAPDYVGVDILDEKKIVAFVTQENADKRNKAATTTADNPEDDDPANDDEEFPDEIKPWKEKLAEVLQTMCPYGFERLTQLLLRECGFSQVEVTQRSGDGGIDGTGRLKINGIFSFNVAFQCKRYSNSNVVGAPAIRDFRGSLTTNIEKGLFITTGTFSKAAREEACSPGKQQIDLLDGEEFINKLAEYEIGVSPVTTYIINEEFFKKI